MMAEATLDRKRADLLSDHEQCRWTCIRHTAAIGRVSLRHGIYSSAVIFASAFVTIPPAPDVCHFASKKRSVNHIVNRLHRNA